MACMHVQQLYIIITTWAYPNINVDVQLDQLLSVHAGSAASIKTETTS